MEIYCVCRQCGNEDVLHDAYAIWNREAQRFEVYNTFDKGSYCNTCEGDCSIEWKEKNEHEERRVAI